MVSRACSLTRTSSLCGPLVLSSRSVQATWPTWPTNSSFVRSFLLVGLCPRGGLFVCPHSTGGPGLVAPATPCLLTPTGHQGQRCRMAGLLAGWQGRVWYRWYGGRGNDLETKSEFSAACDTPGSQPPCEVLCVTKRDVLRDTSEALRTKTLNY